MNTGSDRFSSAQCCHVTLAVNLSARKEVHSAQRRQKINLFFSLPAHNFLFSIYFMSQSTWIQFQKNRSCELGVTLDMINVQTLCDAGACRGRSFNRISANDARIGTVGNRNQYGRFPRCGKQRTDRRVISLLVL